MQTVCVEKALWVGKLGCRFGWEKKNKENKSLEGFDLLNWKLNPARGPKYEDKCHICVAAPACAVCLRPLKMSHTLEV